MMYNCEVCLKELDINGIFHFEGAKYCRDHFIEANNKITEGVKNLLKEDLGEMVDPVNRPSHYTVGKHEVIDIIEDSMSAEAFIGYLEGNIKKYMFRWRYKNGLEDLKKARKYMDFLITKVEKDPS